MSMLYGIGQGLQQAGDIFSKALLAREQQRRENEAIQRALAQQGAENSFREQQLGLSRREFDAAETARQEARSRAQFEDALKLSTTFPNAPLDEATAQEWLKDDRAPMVQTGPTGLDGKPVYSTRPSETEKMRVEAVKNSNRLQMQQLRNAALERRLAVDKELAQLKATLTREQIDSIDKRAEAMLGYNYATLDSREAIANAENAADIMAAEIRREAAMNRTNPLLMIPGLIPQQPPATPPTPPPAPRVPPTVQSPRGRGQGDGNTPAPAPAGGGSLSDALRRRQQQKGSQR